MYFNLCVLSKIQARYWGEQLQRGHVIITTIFIILISQISELRFREVK